jgi:hypothetical protein
MPCAEGSEMLMVCDEQNCHSQLTDQFRDVIASSHGWLVLVIVSCLQWNWILSISKHISLKEYSFEYGQASDVPH